MSSLFSRLTEGSSRGVFVVDADGEILHASGALRRVLGYRPEELSGELLSTIAPQFSERHRDVFEGDVPVDRLPPAGDRIEVELRGAGGAHHPTTISIETHEYADQTLVSGVVEGTDGVGPRKRRGARYETLMSAVDDGIYILDPDFEILEVNQAVVSMTGYSREELVGSHAALLAGDDVLEEAAQLTQELLRSDRDAASITTEIRTASGSRLPIETRFSLYPFEDGQCGQIGVIRDITERKQFEETLTALNRSTRDLLGATSDAEICRLVADTATEGLDLSRATVYLLDADEGVLAPTAVSDGPAGAEVDVPAIPPGKGPVWEAFADDRQLVVEDPDRFDATASAVPGMCLPLEDRGVFVVVGPDGDTFDEEMRTVLDVLAANTEAALERVDRERELRKREREFQEHNRRLRRLDRLNEIIRDIDGAVVRADTIAGTSQEVCDRLVASEWFDFAWIGDRDLSTDEITPQAWAGAEQGYLDAVSFAPGAEDAEPSIRTINTGEPTHVSSVAEDLGTGEWRKAALSREFDAVVSVPLEYEGVTYGMLSAYGDPPAAIDEMTRAVLAELGETIANAMNAVEAKQSLLADSGIEVKLRFEEPDDVMARLARDTSCHVQFRSVVPLADDSTRVYFTAADVPADRITEFGQRSVAIREIRTITERGSTNLFEAEVAGESIASTLVAQGAGLESVTVDGRGMSVVVDLPADADVRSFLEGVRSRYPDVELLGRKRHEQPERTRAGFRTTLEERLSDRQFEILRVAYHSGYFDWPRESTAERIADSLDIAQPTFSRHIRVAERKLLASLLE